MPPLASSKLAVDRSIPAETEHDTYPRSFLTLFAVLMRSTFDYPEPSFTHTADDPSATAALNAGDIDSGHPRPEHRHW